MPGQHARSSCPHDDRACWPGMHAPWHWAQGGGEAGLVASGPPGCSSAALTCSSCARPSAEACMRHYHRPAGFRGGARGITGLRGECAWLHPPCSERAWPQRGARAWLQRVNKRACSGELVLSRECPECVRLVSLEASGCRGVLPRVTWAKRSPLSGAQPPLAHVTAGMTWPLDDGELGGGGVLRGWAREEHRRRQACSLPAPVEPKM